MGEALAKIHLLLCNDSRTGSPWARSRCPWRPLARETVVLLLRTADPVNVSRPGQLRGFFDLRPNVFVLAERHRAGAGQWFHRLGGGQSQFPFSCGVVVPRKNVMMEPVTAQVLRGWPVRPSAGCHGLVLRSMLEHSASSGVAHGFSLRRSAVVFVIRADED